jgi:MOSC domain
MQLKHGIFDEASISAIASDMVYEIARLAGRAPDVRRFRTNVVVRLLRSVPFQEDEWLGGVLSFGERDDAPVITVTLRDVRCSMLNLDPDSASPAPEMPKAVVRANQNNAGIHGAITRVGRLAVGQRIFLHKAGQTVSERRGSCRSPPVEQTEKPRFTQCWTKRGALARRCGESDSRSRSRRILLERLSDLKERFEQPAQRRLPLHCPGRKSPWAC